MEWVPASMWLTHLQLGTPAGGLDYDLAVATHDDVLPALSDAGVPASKARPVVEAASGRALWPIAIGATFGVLALLVLPARRRAAGVIAGPSS
jgi:hypothetical protein